MPPRDWIMEHEVEESLLPPAVGPDCLRGHRDGATPSCVPLWNSSETNDTRGAAIMLFTPPFQITALTPSPLNLASYGTLSAVGYRSLP
ncbi:hypothetical protein E2C01_041861 [Portunus trituberculatus]|uniref:Uncharacterized protein n=1 Tax=Portunus trituberculatus TaxID=210409 RepID=A0A5B7FRU5_PORTR|nr:hypothetical protein [Portunus trituberculatus]